MENDHSEETGNSVRTLNSRSSKTLHKFVAITCYVLCVLGVLMVAKTELRKWFVMGGEATPANTILFWTSLGWAVLFGFLGSKTWPRSNKSSDGESA